MKFRETPISGAYVIELERLCDERGFFARTYCQNEFREYGLNPNLVQCNVSYNRAKGTLRGMHFQVGADSEDKLVRCTAGSIYDVIVDLRDGSPSYLRWLAHVLSAKNRDMLYVPRGLAHGFQTLEEDCEVFYQMSDFFAPGAARGVRWDDPAFSIDWPEEKNRIISAKDLSYPDFRP